MSEVDPLFRAWYQVKIEQYKKKGNEDGKECFGQTYTIYNIRS